MERMVRLVAALAVAYGIYSIHYFWLLRRTAQACDQASNSQVDPQQLIGAQRICSAAGIDTTQMLRKIFPPAPKK